MNLERRKELTGALRQLSTEMAADLRRQMLAAGAVRTRAEALHAEEEVGDDFEVWTDLLSRRAAALWVLKSVYVRVLEDRGLLDVRRIVDPEAQHLFEKLAPSLGETAYLKWVYRDLAQPGGGMPDLFAPQPAEIGTVDHTLSRKLVGLWRSRDPETAELRFRFDDERFDGQLMGDLYQDLDPVVKERYALLQTPDFVRDFILDETLTPALAQWGPEAVRVLDPSCGSGHFLLEAFRRMVEAMAVQRPDCSMPTIVRHALDRVVGIDINDYACALARTRLVLLAMELAEQPFMKAANFYHPHVYWADGLEQVETEQQLQLLLEDDGDVAARRATMTRPEVREVLRVALRPGFHVVVGNPPYITEKDKTRKAYHREKVGKTRRYVSAYREYSLASPFTERCFQLAVPDGYVGLITSNNFMKREFGKALIQDVLAKQKLFKVVDTAGAHIPGHGTPTVLLFGRRTLPVGFEEDDVTVVMGKRGEPSIPEDASNSLVWLSILEGHNDVDSETEYTSTTLVSRKRLAKHPWSMGGGGVADLKSKLDEAGGELIEKIDMIGFGATTREDAVFILPTLKSYRRWALSSDNFLNHVTGQCVRNWAVAQSEIIVFPYDKQGTADIGVLRGYERIFARYRTQLWLRQGSGFRTKRESGGAYYEYSMFYPDRHYAPCKICFSSVATHNHFSLCEDERVFTQTVPIFYLSQKASDTDYFFLLGILNSSIACLWMKQVFHNKGVGGQGGGIASEPWEQFYALDNSKLKALPVPDASDQDQHANRLHELAKKRADDPTSAVLEKEDWSDISILRQRLESRRARDTERLLKMVGLQEELDWLCYKLYKIDKDVEIVPPDQVPPLTPGVRPFEITLARADADRRAQLERGETPSESPTAWFERHRWAPHTEIPEGVPERYAALIRDRIERTKASKNLGLVEQPTYKRRWYNPDYEREEKAALREWLADRLEDAVESHGGLLTAQDIAAETSQDPRLLAAAEVYLGQTVHDLEALFTTLLEEESVPNHPLHRYKPNGLKKRAVWEKTWELQRLEDTTEDEEERKKIQPPVPPKYTQGDFLKPRYYRLRGKLDVPKERFLAFTELPRAESGEVYYGWAGWTPYERARKLLEFDARLDDAGLAVDDRIGLLDTVWRLLPDVARDHPRDARDFRVDVEQELGEGTPAARIEEWLARFPPPGGRRRKK